MTVWNSNIPPKVRFFGWLLLHGCIPMKLFLFRRGHHVITDDTFPFFVEHESLDHALMLCHSSQVVWQDALQWSGIVTPLPSTTHSFLLLWQSYFKSAVYREFGTSLWFVIAWSLWKRWNNFVFSGQLSRKDPLVFSVHLCCFLFKCKTRHLSFLVSDLFTYSGLLLSCSWTLLSISEPFDVLIIYLLPRWWTWD